MNCKYACMHACLGGQAGGEMDVCIWMHACI